MNSAREHPASALGRIAILAGLSLNLTFLHLFGDYSGVSPSPGLILYLLVIAVVLLFGIFAVPARAALNGIPLEDLLTAYLGQFASCAIRWVGAPLALLAWLSVNYQFAIAVLSTFVRTHGADEGAILRDPFFLHAGLALLIWLGAREGGRGFGKSAIWLCKILLVSLLGLLYVYWQHIPAEKVFALDARPDALLPGMGTAVVWYSTPLLLAGSLLRSSGETRLGAREHSWLLYAGWGVAAPLFLGVWFNEWLQAGMQALHIKTWGIGWTLAMRGNPEVGHAQLLVCSLSLLISLRLIPWLLLDLWKVPRHSLRAGLIVGVLVAAVIAFQSPLNSATLPLTLMAGIAGTLSGAVAVQSLNLGAKGQERCGSSPVRIPPPGQMLRSAVTVIGTVLAIALNGGVTPLRAATDAAMEHGVAAAGFELLVVLYGLRRLLSVLLYHPDLVLSDTAFWAWLFCFVGSAAVTVLACIRERTV